MLLENDLEVVILMTAESILNERELFGDEREDYREALQRHYAEGPPSDWSERFVSATAARRANA